MATSAPESVLQMRDIGKTFSGVRVLDAVSFDVAAGEVHVLAGENGAGKSTLMKILCGVYSDHEGEVFMGGRKVVSSSPHEAARQGIAMVHQEMALVRPMAVADNIFLGPGSGPDGFWLRRRRRREQATRLLEELGLRIDVAAPVGDYPIAVQQMIEIAKAMAMEFRILVLDEPTSALTEAEAAALFSLVRRLCHQGRAVVFISHKLEEMYRLGDRITVLRDGRNIGTGGARDIPQSELLRWIVGRELNQQFPERRARIGPVRLAVEGLSVADPLRRGRAAAEGVGFSVRGGEIVGLAGLHGSGNSELLRALFGAYGRPVSGAVSLDGVPLEIRSPGRSIAQGVVLLTNDRKADGLVLSMSAAQNVTLASMRKYSALGWVSAAREHATAERYRRSLSIRLASAAQEVSELSGGNQQKIVLAKWLETEPKILLLDEPTRGVDVGAKHEIYQLMNVLTDAGIGIVLITSEMPELLAMSDRILVMHRGKLSAEFARADATQEHIIEAAMGG